MIESNRPDPGIAKCLKFVGSAKNILLIGNAREDLLRSLDARGCIINCILVGETSADEARVFCSSVEVAPAGAVTLPVDLQESSFDVAFFDGILERVNEPRGILTESRRVLRRGGFVIAMVANLDYGAIRLSLVKDTHGRATSAPPDYFHGFTSQSMNDLFRQAGYRIEHVAHVRRPIFNANNGLPKLQRSDFPQAVVARIEADPISEIYQFVVKAVPLSEGAEVSSSTDSAERNGSAEAAKGISSAPPWISVVEAEPRVELVEDTVLDVRGELDVERATREGLLVALQDARNTAAALEARVSEMAARRVQQDASQTEERLSQLRLVEELRSHGDELKARVRSLEEDLRLSKNAADAQHRELSASVLALEEELETLHKAALANQLVMHDYANELRQRAETASADFTNAIRERDGYYVRMLESDGLLKEAQQRAETAAADFANAIRERDEYYLRMLDSEGLLREARQQAETGATDLANAMRERDEYHLRMLDGEGLLKEVRQQAEAAMADLANAMRERDEYNLRMLDSEGLLKESREHSSSFETEINKLELAQAGLKQAFRSAIEASEAEVAVAGLELSRSRAELQTERQMLQAERQACSEKIARTEYDCDELLTEAISVFDAMRLQVESERRRLEEQHREDGAAAAELRDQVDAVRRASLADKLVMREYADDFRRRAEHAEKELHNTIRQRDDLYLRVVDADRAVAELSESNARLDEGIRSLEERLRDEQAQTARAEAGLALTQTELVDLTARFEGMIADLNARSEVTIAELGSRASSLENDFAHQQAVLQHLRERADGDRTRADVAAAELASLSIRHEILQASLAELDNLLVAQTEQLLVSTSDERDRLLTLIDTVQSSHFWRLKHWLARLRARVFAAIPARRG